MPPKAASKASKISKEEKKAMAAAIAAIAPADHVDAKELWTATDALQKSKALRNFFQLERDKVGSYWNINKRELEQTHVEQRQKEREKVEMQERHQVETKVYKQKIRHVLYEQQVELCQLKLEAELTLRNKEEEHLRIEQDLEKDLRGLKLCSKEQDLLLRDGFHEQAMIQDREISEQLVDFERQSKEMHLKYERMIKTLREEMDKKRNEEVAAIEKRKKIHINELRDAHDKAFQDIKEYFNEITTSNLETIRTLKDEVYSRKRTEAHNEKAMFDIAQTNKKLTEPLTRAHKQKKQLEAELVNYERDKAELKFKMAELSQIEALFKTLQWEHEVLEQRYDKLLQDYDIVFHKHNDVLQELQKKALFKRVLLQRKLDVMGIDSEKKRLQISEILRKSNLDPSAIAGVEQHVAGLMERRDNTVMDLHKLLSEMTERHERVLMAYEQYAKNNGIALIQA